MNITDKHKVNVYLNEELNDKSKRIAEKKRMSRIQYLSLILEEQITNDANEILQESDNL
jgi:hypothetical protein